jgi:N-acetylglucosaminyldiphosphoundecaprenol N-acetyl-beta-D-mannosaminyltransferase
VIGSARPDDRTDGVASAARAGVVVLELPDRFRVIETRITAFDLDEAVRLFLEARSSGTRLRAHFCTTHTLVEASDNAMLREALNQPDAVAAPDGMPLVWVGRAMGRDVGRVCGPDLLPLLVDRGREAGARHFFYGGAPGVAERLAESLAARYPGLVVAGTHSPPFRPLTPDEDAAEVELINAAQPDFVWVGLGSPKQDLWIDSHRDRLDAAVLFAVGAAFDFHAGTLRRAPVWMQRTGTEWFYRLISEPRRLLKRYTVVNTRFVLLLGRQILSRRPRQA